MLEKTMIYNVKSNTGLSGFYIVYKGSTEIENKKTYGVSHLVEHLMMKNIKAFEKKMCSDGITVNAYTSESTVVCFITGLDRYVYKWRTKFLDSLLEFKNLTEDEIENERSVVLEEYTDMFADIQFSNILNIHSKIFKYNQLYFDLSPYHKKIMYINLLSICVILSLRG